MAGGSDGPPDEGPPPLPDLGVDGGPGATIDPPPVARVGRLLRPAVEARPSLEHDLDVVLPGEGCPQCLVEIHPVRAHDEDESVHTRPPRILAQSRA